MRHQAGFTLFELMIAVAVIAILTAIGLPTYHSYVKKAAMTDMLQVMMPYKTSIELCTLELGSLSNCNTGSHGIPPSKSTNYVASVNVTSGVITLTGQNSLSGLTATLTLTLNSNYGHLDWSRTCITSPVDSNLIRACEDVFKF